MDFHCHRHFHPHHYDADFGRSFLELDQHLSKYPTIYENVSLMNYVYFDCLCLKLIGWKCQIPCLQYTPQRDFLWFVHNTVQKYGNTTAATIPLGFIDALREGKIKRGQKIAFAAFGSGFAWGSVVLEY